MAVVIASDDSAYFAAGMRRSHSQPKLSSTKTSFRQSSSASRISDIYHQQQQQHHNHNYHHQSQHHPHSPPPPHSPSAHLLIHSPADSVPSSPRDSRVSSSETTPVSSSPTKASVAGLRLPPRLDRPGYGSSPTDTDDGDEADVAIDYSHYDGVSYFNPTDDLEPLSIPHALGGSYAASPNDNNTLSSEPSRTNSSDFEYCEHVEHAAEDDTAVRALPSRHVDYLSHNWREEDIWESWKYIVSRRGDYSNAARLENASWRTWMKAKNNLKTVSPETLNWLKDCDVTWLYGPLQTGHTGLTPTKAQDSAELTKSNSFLRNSKKPILKKRSMSELMLQRSISASSLLKQAAAAVQAQQKEMGGCLPARPRLERSNTDYAALPFSSNHFTPGITSMMQSNSSSGIGSPSSERKHIHFNEQVEQCIAVEAKDEEDEDDEEDDDLGTSRFRFDDSDDSDDDGAIMMKRTNSRGRPLPRRRHSYAAPGESKTIAMLPSTTLKYQDDLDPSDLGTAMKHTYRSPVMSPSSSQETLRPSRTSKKMFFAEDDEEDEDDDDDDDDEDEYEGVQSRQFASLNGHLQRPADDSEEDEEDDEDDEDEDEDSEDEGLGMSMGSSRQRTGGLISSSASTSRLASYQGQSSFGGGGGGGGLKRTTSTSSLSAEPAGMRRTASGMFMPYDEGEPAGGGNGGLVGRVIDTVNTARDIIHVIWNVGWRK